MTIDAVQCEDNMTVCQCLQHRMNTAARRSLLMTFNHQAFALVSWDYVNGSLPCTVDISEHYDVFAGDKKGRPTITVKSFYTHLYIRITLNPFEHSQCDNRTSSLLLNLLGRSPTNGQLYSP